MLWSNSDLSFLNIIFIKTEVSPFVVTLPRKQRGLDFLRWFQRDCQIINFTHFLGVPHIWWLLINLIPNIRQWQHMYLRITDPRNNSLMCLCSFCCSSLFNNTRPLWYVEYFRSEWMHIHKKCYIWICYTKQQKHNTAWFKTFQINVCCLLDYDFANFPILKNTVSFNVELHSITRPVK